MFLELIFNYLCFKFQIKNNWLQFNCLNGNFDSVNRLHNGLGVCVYWCQGEREKRQPEKLLPGSPGSFENNHRLPGYIKFEYFGHTMYTWWFKTIQNTILSDFLYYTIKYLKNSSTIHIINVTIFLHSKQMGSY